MKIRSLENLQKINLNYVKGLKNNGSHFIDLINYLFSNPKLLDIKILDETIGFNDEDKSYDVFLRLNMMRRLFLYILLLYIQNTILLN